MAMTSKRVPVAALAASATLLVAVAQHEGWFGQAAIPVENDRPTVGFGSTVREDGSPVQIGDTITPPRALARTLGHIQKDEVGIKRCVHAPLHQAEYDLMVDFSYQYGVRRLCESSIVALTNAGDYAGACEAYTRYRWAGGYDCSTPGNKRCWGVWERSLWRRDECRRQLDTPAATTATADAVRPGGGAR